VRVRVRVRVYMCRCCLNAWTCKCLHRGHGSDDVPYVTGGNV